MQSVTRLRASIRSSSTLFYSSHPFLRTLAMVKMYAVVDFYGLRMSLVTCLQRLRVNMVKTKILISAHHEHTFNNGAEFFFFFLTVWLLLVRVPHLFKHNNCRCYFDNLIKSY